MLIRAAVAAFATTLVFATAAGAVDVENASGKEQKVLLTESGGKTNLVLKAGETKMDVCAMCTVTVEGMKPVEGIGLDKVVIEANGLKKVEN